MIELAVNAMLGQKLLEKGLKEEPDFFTVKAPVFSVTKLKGVDHVLGPEMKSTGEVIGLGTTVEEALSKAFFQGKNNPFEPYQKANMIFCSFSDREKQAALPLVRKLVEMNFKIGATKGTHQYLKLEGIVEVEEILTESIVEFIQSGTCAAGIIIPTKGRDKNRNGLHYRALFTRYGIPTFTSLDTAKMAAALNGTVKPNYAPMENYLNNNKKVVEYLCKMY
jgi:carbamoyl-phosphate synthase large subunit